MSDERAAALREQILELVARYHAEAFPQRTFIAGDSDVPVSGKVFDAVEMQHLVVLEVGGISGIIGNNNKINRLAESDFLKYLKRILLKQPKLLLLHQGPDFPQKALMGDSKIREIIEQSPVNLIVCGHCHWHIPLVTFDNGTQILNVDSRVVILTDSKVQSS